VSSVAIEYYRNGRLSGQSRKAFAHRVRAFRASRSGAHCIDADAATSVFSSRGAKWLRLAQKLR